MKRFLRFALLTVFLMTLVVGIQVIASANAIPTIPINGSVTGTVTETTPVTYRIKVDKPTKIIGELYTDTDVYAMNLKTLDGKEILNTLTGTSGIPLVLEMQLNTGEYYIEVSFNPYRGGLPAVGNFRLVLKTEPIANGEIEPNNTKPLATKINIGQRIDAMCGGWSDVDWYTFDVEEEKRLVFDFVDLYSDGSWRLYDDKGTILENNTVRNASTRARTLKKGTYYLEISVSNWSGRYQLSVYNYKYMQSIKLNPARLDPMPPLVEKQISVVTTPADANEAIYSARSSDESIVQANYTDSKKILICGLKPGKATIRLVSSDGKTANIDVVIVPPKLESIQFQYNNIRLTKGYTYKDLPFILTPTYSPYPDLKWTSANPQVLRVNPDNTVQGVSFGQTTLTATVVGNDKIKASCVVTVGKNELTRSKPLYDPSEYGLYSCAKRLYYKGKYLHTEVYLYNHTPHKITRRGNLKLYVFDWDVSETKPVYTKTISWNPGTIQPWKYKVYKFTLPKNKLLNRDLGTGQLEVFIGGQFNARSVGKGLGKSITVKPIPRMLLPKIATRKK